jgi:hypothetical protein
MLEKIEYLNKNIIIFKNSKNGIIEKNYIIIRPD